MLRDLFSLFPACAGVIPDEETFGYQEASFPRMCGGDPTSSFSAMYGLTFSPHVRG